ncbi:Extracellular globin-2B [Lamellibrachia satsuma]|nr:Extracellular globin-2B [Lamellibrachia satsuma]
MWESVWSAENSEQVRIELGGEVFDYIFKRDPGAMQMFKRVNVADLHSPEFEAHVVRVVNGLDILINFLDDRPSLEAAAKHLANQHAARPGVTAGYFQVMDDALVNILPQVVDHFDPDTWERCWHSAVDIITAALP